MNARTKESLLIATTVFGFMASGGLVNSAAKVFSFDIALAIFVYAVGVYALVMLRKHIRDGFVEEVNDGV